MRSFKSLMVVALTALPVAALATDMNGPGYEVHSLNDVVYEAVSDGAHGGAAFWCAAGKFVEVELKMPAGTDIYVVRGAGPSETTNRRTAAQFTVDPGKAGITPAAMGNELNDLVVGSHMTAGEARVYCSTG